MSAAYKAQYQPPAYELVEDDPDTVKMFISLIPEHKKKGKTDEEIMTLAKKEMIKYRVPRPNYLRGGIQKRKTHKKSAKKQNKKITKKSNKTQKRKQSKRRKL